MMLSAGTEQVSLADAGIIFVVLLIFMFVCYTTSSKIGSPSVMYDNLTELARLYPVAGNRGGSYLTFWSINGLKFGILQAVSCWGMCALLPSSKLHSMQLSFMIGICIS